MINFDALKNALEWQRQSHFRISMLIIFLNQILLISLKPKCQTLIVIFGMSMEIQSK